MNYGPGVMDTQSYSSLTAAPASPTQAQITIICSPAAYPIKWNNFQRYFD